MAGSGPSLWRLDDRSPVVTGAWADQIPPGPADDLVRQLFAVGLALSSAEQLVEGTPAADLIGLAAARLDEIIRALRRAEWE
jgi:hypothetical protein